MGCGSVQYKNSLSQEKSKPLKPYPDDINGINDKVANSFNVFLKTHGANPKPAFKERPKLSFDMKDTKSLKGQVINSPRSAYSAQSKSEGFTNTTEFVLAPIREKNSAEESMIRAEEQSFIVNISNEFRSEEEIFEKKLPKFRINISLDSENDIKALQDLEKGATSLINKYSR